MLYRYHVTRLVGLPTQVRRAAIRAGRFSSTTLISPGSLTTSRLLRAAPYFVSIMAEQLVLRGTLEGHNGWVTSLATSLEK